jgi:hypothetical protein
MHFLSDPVEGVVLQGLLEEAKLQAMETALEKERIGRDVGRPREMVQRQKGLWFY